MLYLSENINNTMKKDVKRENIRRIMSEKGITQTALAAQLGISITALSNWINKNTLVSTLDRLAEALGVEVWELLRPSQEEEQNQPREQTKIALNYIICPHCKQSIKLNPE